MRRLVCLFGRCVPLGLVMSVVLAIVGPAPVARAEPPKTHEVLTSRPSGFWTSNRPAEHGAYKWALLGVGVGVAAVAGFVMLRLIKRANAERMARR